MVSFFGDIKGPLSNMIWETAPDSAFAEVRNRRLTEVSVFASGVQNLVEINDISLEVRPTVTAAHQNVSVNKALVQQAGATLTNEAQTFPQPQQPEYQPAVTEAQQIVDSAAQRGAEHIADEAQAFLQQQPVNPTPTEAENSVAPAVPMDELAMKRQLVDQAYTSANPIYDANAGV